MKIQIYVASSWKNIHQPGVVDALRLDGHEVYDFKATENAFAWKELDPNWRSWTSEEYAKALDSVQASVAYQHDMSALENADVCVLVMPSGRSAAFEYGHWRGRTGRHGVLYIPEKEIFEPELMFWGAKIVSSLAELRVAVLDKKDEYMKDFEREAARRDYNSRVWEDEDEE